MMVAVQDAVGSSRSGDDGSHVRLTVVDQDKPASLLRKVVDDLLRGKLGYHGVIVTDDLGMGAITGSGRPAARRCCSAAGG